MSAPVRVLYVDDNLLDRELVRDALEKEHGGFELVEASSRSVFEKALKEGEYELVLSDFNILGFEGLQVLEAVHAKDPHLPVIIVTGTGSEEVAAEAIKRGAADYVIKSPHHIQRLPHTIQTVLEKKRLEEQQLAAEESLRETNELLAEFVKNSPIYAYLKEVSPNESRVVMASENFEQMIGKPGSVIAGKSMAELFPAEFAAKMAADDWAVVSSGKTLRLDEDFNGRAYTTIKFPISQGGKHRLAGYTIDITERRQAEQEIQRRLSDLQVLYESSLGLSSELPPQEIGRSVIGILKAHLNWHHAVIRLRQEPGDRMEIIGYSAPGVTPKNYAAEISRLNNLISHVGQGMIGWVVQHGQPVRAGDLASDPRYIETYVGIHSGLYAPMVSGGKVIGAIAVESELPEAFNELDERLLSTLAKITANAIQRHNLREQTERQIQRLSALRAIDQAISASFDLQITLNIFLRNAITQLGVDAALLLLFNPAINTLEFAAEQGFRSSEVKKVRLHLGEQAAGKVAVERQRISITDLRQPGDLLVHPELAASEDFVSYHGVVLIVKGQVKGVLEVFQRTLMEPGVEWLDFLETLAGQAAIAVDNNQLFENLQRTNFELAIAYDETIEGWSRALDMRDHETEGHTLRVTMLTQKLGVAMGMSDYELVAVRRGTLLHDIGKMGVPDNVLLKPGELTPQEWEIMRQHPKFAYDMLSPITYLRSALEIPYCHHEKWDGTGYPRGLKGMGIPLSARIFAVVDVYDALTSDRPYRKAWTKPRTLEYIAEQSGNHFDPEVVEIFLKVISSEV